MREQMAGASSNLFEASVKGTKSQHAETTNLNWPFLSTSNTKSNALTALQEYGPASWWNTNNYNAGSSLAAASPLSHFNLNSIEDEDAFLYGDSNSLPEEETCVENNPVVTNTDRLDTSWSDEDDDPFVKTPATTTADINSKLAKHLSDPQSGIQPIVKLPEVEKEANLIEDSAPASGIPNKRGVSEKLESRGSVSSPVTEQNEFPEASSAAVRGELQNAGGAGTAWSDEKVAFVKTSGINTTKEDNLIKDVAPSLDISGKTCVSPKLASQDSLLSPVIVKKEFPKENSAVGDQSPFSIDNELHKKHTDEDNVINISSDKDPGTSKHVSNLDRNNLDTYLKIAKSPFKRLNPKVINKKHIDNIRDYIRRNERKRCRASVESTTKKHAKHETPKSASPLGDRFSLRSPKCKSPDHTKRELFCSSRRCPCLETGSHPHEDHPVKKRETSRTFSPSRRYSPRRSSSPHPKRKLSKKKESPYSHFWSKKRPSTCIERHGCYPPSPKKFSPDHDYRCKKRSRKKKTDHNRYSSSPSRHNSPSRSPLTNHKLKSSKRGHKSPHSTRRSPSFGSKERSSRYTERYRRDSSSPKRSRSRDYQHGRRLPEKSIDCSRYKNRKRSRSRSRRLLRSRYRSRRSIRSKSRSRRSLRSRSKSSRSLRSRSRSRRSIRSRSRSRRSLRSKSKSSRSLRSRSRSRRSLRSRSRSRRSLRSRSRSSWYKSPRYYPASTKAYDKKKICKLSKKSAYYSENKEKSPYSSGSSLLSLDSSSSDSDEKNPVKSKDSSPEYEIINLNGCYTYSKKSDSDRKSRRQKIKTPERDRRLKRPKIKSLDTYNVKINAENRLDPVNNHSKLDVVLPSTSNEQLRTDFLEQQPIVAPDSSTSAVMDIDVASDMQIPVISSSGSHDCPTVPPAQATDFPQTFPALIMPAPPVVYGPYLPMPPPVPSNNSQYTANVVSKRGKVKRHSTLRTIPLSATLHTHTPLNSDITVLPNVFPPLESSEKPETQESAQQPFNKKKDEESVSSSSDLVTKSSTSEQMRRCVEQKKLLAMAKLKKIKAERTREFYRSKSGSYLDEMKVLQRMKSSNEDLGKSKNEKANEQKKPIKGAEFVKSWIPGYYCVLCKKINLDKMSVEQHLAGRQHSANYDRFIKKFPTYKQDDENMGLTNQDLNRELCNLQIKVQPKELESGKKETININAETADENENKLDSTCKASEAKLPEVPKDGHPVNASEIDKSSLIQKVSSGKVECCSHCNHCKKSVEKKVVHKYIFIGKCRGYKKKYAEKNKDTEGCVLNKTEHNSSEGNEKGGLVK